MPECAEHTFVHTMHGHRKYLFKSFKKTIFSTKSNKEEGIQSGDTKGDESYPWNSDHGQMRWHHTCSTRKARTRRTAGLLKGDFWISNFSIQVC